MPAYHYRAYAADGSTETGRLTALSRESALEALSRRGLLPAELTEGGSARSLRWWQREVLGSRRIARAQLAMLSRDLATLVEADIPLDEALRILIVQPLLSRRVRTTLEAVLERVSDGQTLSDAFAETGDFPEFYWRLARAGEASGALGPTLSSMARYLERGEEFRQQLRSALAYPIVLAITALATLMIVSSVLVPTLVPVLTSAGAPLPPAIALIVAVQEAIVGYWPVLAGAAAVLVAVIARAFSDEKMRLALHRGLLRMPALSSLIRQRETARFAGSMSTMLASGVPMLEALGIAGRAQGNLAYARGIAIITEEVSHGGGLRGPLERSGLFSELALRLVSVGEQTGQLEAMLGRVAVIYETALQRDLQRISTLAGPALTVIIGVMVGGLMLSVLGTLVGINELALK